MTRGLCRPMLLPLAGLLLLMGGMIGCTLESGDGLAASEQAATGTAVAGIRGLDAVPPGFALLVEGESREGSRTQHVRSLIVPELGVFRMELEESVYDAAMVITVRTRDKQSGYRGQAVLVGTPRPMDMAFLESPLTYPSDQWRVTKATRSGDHVSATLARGSEPAVEERTVAADIDPETGLIVVEEQSRQYLTSRITRRLVPLGSLDIPDLEEVLAFATADWRKTLAASESLGYPVFGLDLPGLQLHMLQSGDGTVWLDYSTVSRPGRLAVRTWQMPDAEARAVPTRFGEAWTAGSTDRGERGQARTFFVGDRAVQVFVFDWLLKEDPRMLDKIEAALMPLSRTAQAAKAEPPVLLFDEPMPLPSGADFGGLLPEDYRGVSG